MTIFPEKFENIKVEMGEENVLKIAQIFTRSISHQKEKNLDLPVLIAKQVRNRYTLLHIRALYAQLNDY